MENTIGKLAFVKSIKFKLLLIVVISTLIGSPVVSWINSALISFGVESGAVFTASTFLVQLLTIPLLVVIFAHLFITKRINDVNRQLAKIEQGNFEKMATDRWNDEMSQLGKNVSSLAETLTDSIEESQRRSNQVYEQSKVFKQSFDTLYEKNEHQNELLTTYNKSNKEVYTILIERTVFYKRLRARLNITQIRSSV
ncbi:hypothetical protein [Desertibacillus haloalkaliphilus]|uniref:hypothetical protein n=1 Tax=Desertibacillus haloalkaliphilus TaxID=1328930 RepID=UPI001C26FD54|nr:hypothetical protein [Desertibacillus haloalkaliphilus]MBU8906842.1 hypothetical protein [Desertibacillus haloalkaliphilus]